MKCSCSVRQGLQQREQGKAGTGSQFSQICATGELILRLCAPTVVGIQHKVTGESKCRGEQRRSERRAASLSSPAVMWLHATSPPSPTSAC